MDNFNIFEIKETTLPKNAEGYDVLPAGNFRGKLEGVEAFERGFKAQITVLNPSEDVEHFATNKAYFLYDADLNPTFTQKSDTWKLHAFLKDMLQFYSFDLKVALEHSGATGAWGEDHSRILNNFIEAVNAKAKEAGGFDISLTAKWVPKKNIDFYDGANPDHHFVNLNFKKI